MLPLEKGGRGIAGVRSSKTKIRLDKSRPTTSQDFSGDLPAICFAHSISKSLSNSSSFSTPPSSPSCWDSASTVRSESYSSPCSAGEPGRSSSSSATIVSTEFSLSAPATAIAIAAPHLAFSCAPNSSTDIPMTSSKSRSACFSALS